ncbi:iron complex outermembrane receptor protein [Rhizobium sp. SG_E_25_P2]|uniref:TonB-dependent siderophore receptor n=1 Tax=Rhizobium sp. SG_E_25_P2 TaxID=2879942 RepID=UPI0024759E0F|nr:TonB-dependent siderophore receptor [Rhizobium sp. SG_E_25_P2]MDH6267793.1 iron complex outermembrane receptor protein [Rhizobium sp. SG_E_25_P2]
MTQMKRGASRAAWLAAGVAAIALAAAHGAAAQEATQLKKIVVETDEKAAANGPVKGYAAEATEAGAKMAMPIARVPQSVSVIGREEIEDRAVSGKIDEALRYASGVTAQPFGSDPDTDWVYIRGFDATQTGGYLDGLNLQSYGFGGFQIDSYFLDRITVLKGPSSALYGGGSPGGIVDMTRKTPTDQPLLSTEAGVNNFGNGYVGFDASNAIKDSAFSYRLTAKVSGGNYQTDYGNDLRSAVMPQLTWSPDDATKLNVFAYYSTLDQRHGAGSFLPYYGTVKNAPFGKVDPDNYYGEPDLDEGTTRQTMIGYSFEHELESGVTLKQTLRYGHVKKYENAPYTYGCYDAVTYFSDCSSADAANAEFYRIGFEHHTSVDAFNVDTHAEGSFDTGPVSHDLMVGIDYRYFGIDQVQASGYAAPISVLDPEYGADIVTTPYLIQDLVQQQVGLYAQNQMRFGAGWVATLNGRYDFVHTDSDYDLGGTDYVADNKALSGRAGLAYEFANGVTPYVSASTFFDPVIGTTASGEGLDPEEGYQLEAGVKYRPDFIDGVFTASVFQIVKQNWTLTNPTTYASEQIGEVKSRGIELEAKVDLTEQWRAVAGFTYLDMEITQHNVASYVGNSPYLIPDVSASAWLDYKLPVGMLDGVSIGGGLRYQGKSWADMENTLRVPGAVVADAAIRYQKDNLGVSLTAANLFDKEYVTGCQGTLVCSYGAGRTVMLKINKLW